MKMNTKKCSRITLNPFTNSFTSDWLECSSHLCTFKVNNVLDLVIQLACVA